MAYQLQVCSMMSSRNYYHIKMFLHISVLHTYTLHYLQNNNLGRNVFNFSIFHFIFSIFHFIFSIFHFIFSISHFSQTKQYDTCQFPYNTRSIIFSRVFLCRIPPPHLPNYFPLHRSQMNAVSERRCRCDLSVFKVRTYCIFGEGLADLK